MGDPGVSTTHCCKVGRIADAYGLDDVDDDLIGLHESGGSMRELAAHLNTSVIEAAIDSADEQVVADPVGIFDVLQGEEVAPERKIRIEEALESAGVDVADLRSDLVSHVTVWTHVKEHLSRSTERTAMVEPDEAVEVIDRAREREETIIANALERLDEHPEFEAGDIDVSVSVRVFCRECGDSHRLSTYLDGGGCGCGGEG